MPVIESRIDPGSDAFRTNRAQMLALIGEFRALEQKVRDFSNSRRERFRARKQLLPRERVALAIDPGAPWLELSTLAGFRMHDDDGADGIQGGGSIAGIGYVSGIRCVVTANDSAIKGGTSTPMGVKKQLARPADRAGEQAAARAPGRVRRRQPALSGGDVRRGRPRLRQPGAHVGCRHSRRSPSCTAHRPQAAPICPACRTTSILVRGRAKVFLAGPPLLRAATGEIATDEELGGAEMHATVSGLGEYLAEDDADGIRIAREVMAKLPWNEQPAAAAAQGFQGAALCGGRARRRRAGRLS